MRGSEKEGRCGRICEVGVLYIQMVGWCAELQEAAKTKLLFYLWE